MSEVIAEKPAEEIEEETVESTPEATTATEVKSINDLAPKMQVTGRVTRLELYGAFIDLGLEVKALIHISQLGKEHVNRVADILKIGDEVMVWIDKVDVERKQIMVSMIEPLAVEWRDLKVGQVYAGTVTRLENFGAFLNIGAEREGLVHISELSHEYIKNPSEVATVGEVVQAQVLGFSKRKRRIDLSLKALLEKPEAEYPAAKEAVAYLKQEEEILEDVPTAMEYALRAAMGDDMPPPRKKKKMKRKQRRRQEKMRAQQSDIMSRTLQN